MSGNAALISQLGAIDLFSGLSPKTLAHIADVGEELTFEPGAVVTAEGAKVGGFAPFSREGVYFHLVLDGSADVSRQGAALGSVDAGGYFGELSLIDGEPRSAEVVAGAHGLRTFALQKWTFETLLEEHPDVAVPMLRVVTARLRASEARNGA